MLPRFFVLQYIEEIAGNGIGQATVAGCLLCEKSPRHECCFVSSSCSILKSFAEKGHEGVVFGFFVFQYIPETAGDGFPWRKKQALIVKATDGVMIGFFVSHQYIAETAGDGLPWRKKQEWMVMKLVYEEVGAVSAADACPPTS